MRLRDVLPIVALAVAGCSAETCGHTEKAIESAGHDVERAADEAEAKAGEAYQDLKAGTARGVEFSTGDLDGDGDKVDVETK